MLYFRVLYSLIGWIWASHKRIDIFLTSSEYVLLTSYVFGIPGFVMRYNLYESVCGHSQNVLVSVLNVTVEIRNDPSPVRMPRSKACKSLRTVD
jgi:hypothetical protein